MMGMYDSIKNFAIPCPSCGKELNTFQTKDMGEGMMSYNINQLWDGCEIYDYCKCGKYVTLHVNHVVPPKIMVTMVDDDEPAEDEIKQWAELVAKWNDMVN